MFRGSLIFRNISTCDFDMLPYLVLISNPLRYMDSIFITDMESMHDFEEFAKVF